MKKIALALALTALLAGCSKLKSNEYEVTGTVDASWEGKMVTLEKQSMFGIKKLDSVKVQNATFRFQDTISEPGVYFVQFGDLPGQPPAEFILEPGEIKLKIYKDSVSKSVPSGTYNNDKYVEFLDVFKKSRKVVDKFEVDNQKKLDDAKKAKDFAAVEALQKQHEELTKKSSLAAVAFIKENPKAYVSLLAIPGIYRMKIVSDEEVRKLYEKLDESLKKTSVGRQTGYMIKSIDAEKKAVPKPAEKPVSAGVKVGDKAPSFSAKSSEGKEISLAESLGKKVTIIDFWASWCPPCRKENPNMVALYKKFHNKGLNIIGVSLDQDADKWKNAIAKDGLLWSQVSNLMYWDEPIAKQYGVEQIPAPFVLDASGTVVARDIYGADLEKEVEKMLK